MSTIFKITLFSLTLLTVNQGIAATQQPNDYAYGAEIAISNDDSAFSTFSLNSDVYLQTSSPTLDDMRIFNRNGQLVPFSLMTSEEHTAEIPPIKLELYSMNEDAPTDRQQTENNYSVAINGHQVNVNISGLNSYDNQAPYTYSYLLKFPADKASVKSFSRYKLSWSKDQHNWQAKVNIYYSDNLKYWRQAGNQEPVMEMTNAMGETLRLDEINSDTNYSNNSQRYWLMTVSSQTPIPQLQSVDVYPQPSKTIEQVKLDFSLVSSNDTTAEYQLASPQPLQSLAINLQQSRTVQPVAIYYKSSDTAENWTKLTDRVIYSNNDEELQPFIPQHMMPLIKRIQIQAINSSWQKVPALSGYRNQVDVVFNSANNGPFILAWGKPNTERAALPISNLLPPTMSLTSVPKAVLDKAVTLGGEKVLHEQEKQSSTFPKWVIWAALVIGALFLVFLAYKLSKELKSVN